MRRDFYKYAILWINKVMQSTIGSVRLIIPRLVCLVRTVSCLSVLSVAVDMGSAVNLGFVVEFELVVCDRLSANHDKDAQ